VAGAHVPVKRGDATQWGGLQKRNLNANGATGSTRGLSAEGRERYGKSMNDGTENNRNRPKADSDTNKVYARRVCWENWDSVPTTWEKQGLRVSAKTELCAKDNPGVGGANGEDGAKNSGTRDQKSRPKKKKRGGGKREIG